MTSPAPECTRHGHLAAECPDCTVAEHAARDLAECVLSVACPDCAGTLDGRIGPGGICDGCGHRAPDR